MTTTNSSILQCPKAKSQFRKAVIDRCSDYRRLNCEIGSSYTTNRQVVKEPKKFSENWRAKTYLETVTLHLTLNLKRKISMFLFRITVRVFLVILKFAHIIHLLTFAISFIRRLTHFYPQTFFKKQNGRLHVGSHYFFLCYHISDSPMWI